MFLSYGPHDNSTLLAEYGFISIDNPYNCILVDEYAAAVLAELLIDDVKQMLVTKGLWGYFYVLCSDFYINADGEFSPRIFYALDHLYVYQTRKEFINDTLVRIVRECTEKAQSCLNLLLVMFILLMTAK